MAMVLLFFCQSCVMSGPPCRVITALGGGGA